MIAFVELLEEPARQAGIKVPEADKWKKEDFLRWHIFISAQLGQSMPSPSCHWENAKVVAAIPEGELKTINLKQLYERGFQVGYPTP